jgi:hypothetical protein
MGSRKCVVPLLCTKESAAAQAALSSSMLGTTQDDAAAAAAAAASFELSVNLSVSSEPVLLLLLLSAALVSLLELANATRYDDCGS